MTTAATPMVFDSLFADLLDGESVLPYESSAFGADSQCQAGELLGQRCRWCKRPAWASMGDDHTGEALHQEAPLQPKACCASMGRALACAMRDASPRERRQLAQFLGMKQPDIVAVKPATSPPPSAWPAHLERRAKRPHARTPLPPANDIDEEGMTPEEYERIAQAWAPTQMLGLRSRIAPPQPQVRDLVEIVMARRAQP